MKRFLLSVLTLLLAVNFSWAQPAYMNKNKSTKPNEGDKFLQTQWWLGFKSGINTSEASPDALFSGYSPTNYSIDLLEKQYNSFGDFSGQAGLEITFYHRGFSFSFQPNYQRQTFAYSNSYEWQSNEDASNTISLNYDHNHKLDFIELPLIVKYDILKTTKFRPFVQAGVFYSRMVNATKEIEISGEDLASGSAGPFENQSLIIGVNDLFIQSNTGWLAGLGINYDFWNVRLVLDVTYRGGLNNITNAQNRYSENALVGIGDAMDDVSLNNVMINVGALFPLRFISSGLNPVR